MCGCENCLYLTLLDTNAYKFFSSFFFELSLMSVIELCGSVFVLLNISYYLFYYYAIGA